MTAVAGEEHPEHRVARKKGAGIAIAWAGLNAILAGALFAFGGPTGTMRIALYWSAVVLVVLWAGALLLPRRSPGVPAAPSGGATSPAFALACLIGGFAWVFGVYLAYFALPLLAFCAGRWARELRRGSRR